MTSRLDLGLHIIVLMLNESLREHRNFSFNNHCSYEPDNEATDNLAGSTLGSTQELHYDSIIRRLSIQDIYSSTNMFWHQRILLKGLNTKLVMQPA